MDFFVLSLIAVFEWCKCILPQMDKQACLNSAAYFFTVENDEESPKVESNSSTSVGVRPFIMEYFITPWQSFSSIFQKRSSLFILFDCINQISEHTCFKLYDMPSNRLSFWTLITIHAPGAISVPGWELSIYPCM